MSSCCRSGALAIECREDDKELLDELLKLTSKETKETVTAERAFLHKMEGGCQVPIAGYATITDNAQISLTALVADPNGKIIYKETVMGEDPVIVGEKAAAILTEQGAKQLIDRVKQEQE